MNGEWNQVDDPTNIQDNRLVVGKEYLVVTFGGDYHVAKYTGKSFFGIPFLVAAWSEFERYQPW